MRSSIYRFLSICLELADLVDENGGAGHEIYNKQLGIGYQVLSGYLRKGVQETIDLQAKYYGAIASKTLRKSEKKKRMISWKMYSGTENRILSTTRTKSVSRLS